ncbi:hypothetical protein [Oxalobacter formigenes]|jgi:hypothetical protein
MKEKITEKASLIQKGYDAMEHWKCAFEQQKSPETQRFQGFLLYLLR